VPIKGKYPADQFPPGGWQTYASSAAEASAAQWAEVEGEVPPCGPQISNNNSGWERKNAVKMTAKCVINFSHKPNIFLAFSLCFFSLLFSLSIRFVFSLVLLVRTIFVAFVPVYFFGQKNVENPFKIDIQFRVESQS